MVREDQVPPELPVDPGRQGAGHGTRRALRESGLLNVVDDRPGAALKRELIARARAEGFQAVRVADASRLPDFKATLDHWLAEERHGEMGWMTQRVAQRASPRALWPQVRSIIMLGASYAPEGDPLATLARKDRAAISLYARRRDYHDVLKGRLKTIAALLPARAGADCKVFVDTAPVMEKPLAAAAGLGWIGKNTILVSREHGDWLWLGAIFTTAALPADEPETDHCGTCRRCLDICPTDAFPAPYQLDARRCIAYLTIEHAGPIAADLRPGIGNRIFGCDDCLAVCPWNKFATAARDAKLAQRDDLDALPLGELSTLDDAGFRQRFAGTPIKRTGRDRFLRNVLIAIGNSGEAALIPAAEARLEDASPLVRGMAVWALGQLAPERLASHAARLHAGETDPHVQGEWSVALRQAGVA